MNIKAGCILKSRTNNSLCLLSLNKIGLEPMVKGKNIACCKLNTASRRLTTALVIGVEIEIQ